MTPKDILTVHAKPAIVQDGLEDQGVTQLLPNAPPDGGASRGRMSYVLIVLAILAVLAHTIPYLPLWVGGDGDASLFTWSPPAEVAAGKAFQGPWRMNESEFHYVDDPTLTFNSEGHLALAWVDNEAKEVFFQRYDKSGRSLFPEPVNVTDSGSIFSWLPRIAFNGEHVYLLWQEIIFSGGSHGGEILFAASKDGGQSFSSPINLSNTTAGAGKGRLSTRRWDNGSLDLSLSGDGTAYAAWTEYEGRLHLSRSLDGGESFSTPLHITGSDTRPARAPALAVDRDGVVHLAWSVRADGSGGIYYAFSQDRGKTFSKGAKINDSHSKADAPRLAIDSQGTLHLVFSEQRSWVSWSQQVFYARKKEAAEGFEAPRLISIRGRGALSGSGYPDLAIDAADNLFVIWHLFPPKSRAFGVGFTLSTDSGDSFAPADIVPGTTDATLSASGSRQGFLARRLSATGNGQIALVTSTFNKGHSSHIWLIRGELE